MSTPDLTDRIRPSDEPATPARRRVPWWAAVAGAVVLVGVGGWLALALNPSIESAGMSWGDVTQVDESGIGRVTDPDDRVYDGAWAFRNDGRFPVTVRLAPPANPTWEWRALLFPLEEPDHFTPSDQRNAADELTVAPGEQFGVSFAVGLGCGEYVAGSGIELHTLGLEVTHLGLTHTIEVEGTTRVAVMTTTDHQPAPDC